MMRPCGVCCRLGLATLAMLAQPECLQTLFKVCIGQLYPIEVPALDTISARASLGPAVHRIPGSSAEIVV